MFAHLKDRFAPKAVVPAKVGFWYETEMPPQSLHVRYREQSGRHLLAASISPFDPNATSSHCTAPTRDDPPGRPEKMNIVLLDWLQSVRARNADSIVRSRPSDPTARSDQRIPERAARNSSNAAMAVQRWHP
jgi:hypothetical protein